MTKRRREDRQTSEPPSPNSDVRSSALKAVAWVSAERWASRLTSLVTFALLGRLLSPEAFGLVSLAMVAVSLLTVFVDAGFSQVLVQRTSLATRQISTAFWTSIGLAALMYGTLALAAAPLARLYDQPLLEPILYLLGLQLPITAISSIPSSLLVRELKFGTLAIRSMSGVACGSVAGVVAALAGAGVWALVIQTLSTAVISALILQVFGSWRPTFEFDVDELKKMWAFGASILGTEAMNLINGQADKLIVGSFLGPTALGYYYVASRLVVLVSDMLTTVVSRVSLTVFSRLQDDLERLMRAYYSATFVSAAVALPAFGALAALAPLVVPIVFGDQWDPSVSIMLLLIPSTALASVMYFDKSALLARGFSRDTFLLAVANTVLGLGFVAVAAPFGVHAVALSRSLRQVVFWPIRQTVMRKRLGLDVRRYLTRFVKPLTATLVSCGVMIGMSAAVPGPDLVRALTAGATGALVYVMVMLLIARKEISGLSERLAVLGSR